MPMTINKQPNVAQQFASAIQSGDNAEIATASEAVMQRISDSIRSDFEAYQQSNDRTILAERGYRQLTATEDKWYDIVEQSLRSTTPKQTFIELIGEGKDEDLMPITIIQDVFKDLERDHKLLQVISFMYTGYATKWLRNKHEFTKAVWGKITDKIKGEITSDLELMTIENNKLTAFAIIPLDILDMGHTFLDAYIRTCLKEAIYDGLEYGIINGKGVASEPVGLMRKVAADVDVNATTGYPEKTAIKVTSFDIKTYLGLVSKLSKSEKGRTRKVQSVCLLVNTTDDLLKIKPATTMLTQLGYTGNVFPFPTDVIPSEHMPEGKAVVFLPGRYTFCVGGSRNGSIEFDDSLGFLDDTRTFKIVQHGDGIADDDTVAIVIDISELETLIPSVKVANTVSTTVVGDVAVNSTNVTPTV